MHYLFVNEKTENYFISQCGGWVKELYDFDREIKSNRFLSRKLNKGLKVEMIRDDSYYSTYKFELNLGLTTDGSWRINFEDQQVNTIEKVITDFESIIKRLPSLCSTCGCQKDEDNHILKNIEGNSKDQFFHEVTVDFRSTERCHTCNYLVNRDEYNIHLFNLSKIKINEFISPENSLVYQFNENLSWPTIKSPIKVRVINPESIFFEYLSEKCFIFCQENLLYKTSFSEFYSVELNHLSNIRGIKKGVYAGQNTGFKDIYSKEIFTGDVISFKWNNFKGCAVVSSMFHRKEFHVIGNFWDSSLSELSEMEIIGNIFFDLDKANNVDISRVAHVIGNYGLESCENLNEIQKVKQFLSSKITPSFKRRKWFRFRLSRIWKLFD
jgi:hypothetical protein